MIIIHMHTIFAIYKSKGPTSHDVVERIRKITGIKKVGHAGTLDPLATGVLVIGVGRQATKQLGKIVKKEKEYIATITFGEESTTDDEEGEKKKWIIKDPPKQKQIEDIIHEFIGEVMQVPPVYSAVKVGGTAAYKRVRRGEVVHLEGRRVLIKNIHIIKYKWPVLILKVTTGPGVYIRSLARDIGKQLNVGGYLADLERTKVGEFTKEKSLTISQFEQRYADEPNHSKT